MTETTLDIHWTLLKGGFQKSDPLVQHTLPLVNTVCVCVWKYRDNPGICLHHLPAVQGLVAHHTTLWVIQVVHCSVFTTVKEHPHHYNCWEYDPCCQEIFWSQTPRKSSPTVMSTTHETPCMVYETIWCRFKTNKKEILQKWYKTTVATTFLYGCENWSLMKLHVGSDTVEMKYLRSIAGNAWYDY